MFLTVVLRTDSIQAHKVSHMNIMLLWLSYVHCSNCLSNESFEYMYDFSEYVFWGCFGKQDQFMVKIFFHVIYFTKHLNKFQ